MTKSLSKAFHINFAINNGISVEYSSIVLAACYMAFAFVRPIYGYLPSKFGIRCNQKLIIGVALASFVLSLAAFLPTVIVPNKILSSTCNYELKDGILTAVNFF